MIIFAEMKDRKLINAELHRISAAEYGVQEASGIAVVLDNVRSAYNVGSVFRSGDAFHADKILLCGICALPPSAEIHKTALGAEEVVPWEHFEDTLDAIHALRADGYTVVAVEQTEHSLKLSAAGIPAPETASLRSAPPVCDGPLPLMMPGVAQVTGAATPAATEAATKYAFVFGNEVEGVQQAVVDECDFALEIEQHGTKHSLNVAVTAGIVLFAASQR